jgi:putative membrane protein
MHGEGGWLGAGMWVFWILLIVIIVVLVRAVAGSSATPPQQDRHETPLEILKARYARGEIDEEEYERRRRELEK